MAFYLVPFIVLWRRLVRIGVPFLVSSYRLVLASRSCLVGWRSRVGVSLVVSVLASRFSFRFSSRVGVPVLSDVSCRCCVSVLSCCAVFVSSGFRAVSSFLVAAVALFVFVPSCVSDGVAALVRCDWAGRGVGNSAMPFRVA